MIGGQAVIEGVMFVSPKKLSLGVRLPNKKIHVESESRKRSNFAKTVSKIPFIRGVFSFATMILIGLKYLNKSAELALSDEEKKSSKATKSEIASSAGMMVLSGVLGLAIGILVFKFIPFTLSHFIVPVSAGSFALALVEGFFKLCIIIVYLYVIGQFADIKRVFMYHGAEHKVIRCVEAGKKLTVKNVADSPRYHPRCGTSFLIFVILISVFVYSFVSVQQSYILQFFFRLCLLPVVAAIAFEVLQLTAKISSNSVWAVVQKPGFFVQSLTTREPTTDQIDVAIASYNALGVTKEDLK